MSWSSSSRRDSGGVAEAIPAAEGVDGSPSGPDAGERSPSSATAPGPFRCGGRRAGRWPTRRVVPAPMAARTSACSSSSRAARVRNATGDVETGGRPRVTGRRLRSRPGTTASASPRSTTRSNRRPRARPKGATKTPSPNPPSGRSDVSRTALFEHGAHGPREGAELGPVRHRVELAEGQHRAPHLFGRGELVGGP